jgi:hypothetical protein
VADQGQYSPSNPRVYPKPSQEVASGLADVRQGFMADNTDTIDARTGWQCAERGSVEGGPGGPLERDHAAVSPRAGSVSTIGPLLVISILTFGTVRLKIMRNRRFPSGSKEGI